MCKFFNSYEGSLHLGVCKLAKYVRNCVVFWKNLQSWQKFYTNAGRDKFQVWKHQEILEGFEMLLSQHHKRRGNHWAIWNPMGKYRRIKPCDCGWSFTTLRKQRCEPSAWTLLNTYYFTLPILCSHVAPYCIIFSILCFFATASLSSSPTFQQVHVLRVCDQIPTILWPSGRVNHATPPTLSCHTNTTVPLLIKSPTTPS